MAILRIARQVLDDVVKHARDTYPRECCGILAGVHDRATHMFRMRNISPDPEVAYLMDAREQLWAFRNVRDNHLRLLSVYHSHPATAAYPSAVDVALAHYADVYYPIVSLVRPDKPEVRVFRIADGRVDRAELVVD